MPDYAHGVIARTHRLLPTVGLLVGVLLAGCTSGDDDPASKTDGAPDPADESTGAFADGYVVTLGDSYISGEGVRWAGNTAGPPKGVDALGPTAYFDKGKREAIRGCHRSAESIADIGGGLLAANLACSGARTASSLSGSTFKPGLDFFDDGHGHIGQALALQKFAIRHRVEVVVVSIGGNNFNFSSMVAQCATDFATSVGRRPTYCKADPNVTANIAPDQVADVTADITEAYVRVGGAMRAAGYEPDDYSILVLDYPSPLATGAKLRYPEVLGDRLDVGGCPVFDADATWANDTLLPTINGAVAAAAAAAELPNLQTIEMSDAFAGHQLCEEGVHQLTETGLGSWQDNGAEAQLEWVNAAYTKGAPWQLQESFHPNYWGMLAEQSCVAAAVSALPAAPKPCRPAS